MKRLTERIQRVQFPIWRSWVNVLITSDVAASIKKHGGVDGHEDTEAMCMHVCDNSTCSMLVLPRDVSPGVIAHESWHAIYRMLNGLDVKLENETVAYNVGYLVDRVHKFLEQTKRKR